MSSLYIFIVVIITVAFLGFDLYIKKQRKKLINKLIQLLISTDFKEFDELIDSNQVKRLIPFFNLKLLEFNSAILRKNKDEARKVFDNLQNKKMSKRQTIEFYGKALNYFIQERDEMRARECYIKIEVIDGYQKEKAYLLDLYKIMMLGETDEETIENRLISDSNQEKVADYYLLARINEINKNFTKAKRYNQLADSTITKIVE
jgi:hypothetical protein